MSTVWTALLGAGVLASLAFVAGGLLSLPGLFSPDALRRRRRIPMGTPEVTGAAGLPSAVGPPTRPLVHAPFGWRRFFLGILWAVVVVPYSVFLCIVLIPAFIAMSLVATFASYRFYRHLASRALRRRKPRTAWLFSWALGMQILLQRMRRKHVVHRVPPAIDGR